MSNSFEKTSWRWQLEQLQQRAAEWIEVNLQSIDRLPANNQLPPWIAELLVRLTWLILAGLLLWFSYRIIYPYWQKWVSKSPPIHIGLDRAATQIYTVAELLARSQQFHSEGDYTQASRWLYLALLQRLSDTNLIPHQPSRTDREYLKLLQTFPTIESGEVLISTHEQLHFSNTIITSGDFDRCQQAYRQVEEGIGDGRF